MEKYSVGEITQSNCPLLNDIKKKGIGTQVQTIENLSETDLTLLKLRTESSYELKTICLRHQSVYLKKYEFYLRHVTLLKKHTNLIKKALRIVTKN